MGIPGNIISANLLSFIQFCCPSIVLKELGLRSFPCKLSRSLFGKLYSRPNVNFPAFLTIMKSAWKVDAVNCTQLETGLFSFSFKTEAGKFGNWLQAEVKVLSPYGKVFYGQHSDTKPDPGKGPASPKRAANKGNQKMKAIAGNLNQSRKGQQSTMSNANKEGENSSLEISIIPQL